jgi:hypothetical protein
MKNFRGAVRHAQGLFLNGPSPKKKSIISFND